MDLIDLMQARSERDKAIQKVSLNNPNFMDMALYAFPGMKERTAPGEEFTGEDISHRLFIMGIVPSHPNALGALIMQAVKRGLIVGTGKYVSMKSVKSHARKTQLYRWA